MNLKYSFLVLLIGCGEKAVTINNTAPEVTITSHEDGDVAFTDVAIEFRASVSDANDDFLDLEVQWKVGDRVACPFLAPDSSGISTCTTTLRHL